VTATGCGSRAAVMTGRNAPWIAEAALNNRIRQAVPQK